MPGPNDLYDLLAEFLDAVEAAVATTPGGAIARAYVSPGPPAWDCELIAVHAGGPLEADTAPLAPPLQPGHRVIDTFAVNEIAITTTVLRCVPTIQQVGGSTSWPSAAELEAAARLIDADVWAIWNHVKNAVRDGTLFRRADGEAREVFFDPAVPLSPAGGYGGWQIPLRVSLEGYS